MRGAVRKGRPYRDLSRRLIRRSANPPLAADGARQKEAGSPQLKGALKDSHFIASVSRHAVFTEVYDQFLSGQLQEEASTATAAAETVIEDLTDLAALLKELETVNLSPAARAVRQALKAW